MIKYLKKILEEFPEDVKSTSASPAVDHMFHVREENQALPEEQDIQCHHSVAQLLFMSSRSCRDIQLAVSFLTTWVNAPDEDDWGKPKRVMK